MTNSTNYCRSDATLGHAARMLLLDVCEPGCGYSDHDIPQHVWRDLGVQFEAFLEVAGGDAQLIEDVYDSETIGTHWIGSRNGDGIGFWSLALNQGLDDSDRDALTNLDKLAKSQGQVGMYAGDDASLYLATHAPLAWITAYETAREAYGA